MKPSQLLPLVLLMATASGQVVVPTQEAAGAAPYGPRAIEKASGTLRGKLIKLQFICRSSQVENNADGGVTGEVVDSPGARIKVDVRVPKDAVNWFMQIPTSYSGGPGYTIYARLAVDKFGAPVADLLGRTLRSDANGSRIEW